MTPDVGLFARAGWAHGTVEPWDFTDIDQTVQVGVSIAGTKWGRPDDRIGIAGILNNIAGVHQEFFNLGGLGIFIGDGILPNSGFEKIFEAHYSYAVTSSTKLTFDYNRQSGLQHRPPTGQRRRRARSLAVLGEALRRPTL